MRMLKSMTLAFAMYSRIPMPRTEWTEENMEYVFCFFPLIGVVVGLCWLLWLGAAALLQLSSLLQGAGVLALSFAVTGGIHLDGFCDTCDALASHQSQERKLEIMKDSHIGAFGVMGCCLYLIGSFALWSSVEISLWTILPLCLAPVLSRALSGLAAVTLPNARGSGMLATFTTPAKGKAVKGTLIAVTAVCIFLMGPAGLIGGGLSWLIYLHTAKKEFAGITGDTEGWFLQLTELLVPAAVVLGQAIGKAAGL